MNWEHTIIIFGLNVKVKDGNAKIARRISAKKST